MGPSLREGVYLARAFLQGERLCILEHVSSPQRKSFDSATLHNTLAHIIRSHLER